MKLVEISPLDIEYNLVNLSQVTFEVTDACNLRCKYCGFGELYYGHDERNAVFMDFTMVKTVLDYLCDFWNKHNTTSGTPRTTISFYGGEPLLNMPLIKRTVDYIESISINRKFQFSMTTNGMLLDKCMDYLVDKKFSLLISLDGDREAHSYRITPTGDNSFDTLYSNITLLKKRHPHFFEQNVAFNAVLNDRSNIEKVFRYIKDTFGKIPTISRLNNSDINPDKREAYKKISSSIPDRPDLFRDAAFMEDFFLQAPGMREVLLYLYRFSGNTFEDYIDLFTDSDALSYLPTGVCSPFAKKMFVTVNGKIIQCERINHSFALGYVSGDTMNLDLNEAASKANYYISKVFKQCSGCAVKKSCYQCVYYIEGIESERPVCQGYMNNNTFEHYKKCIYAVLSKDSKLYKKLMTEVLYN